jgi:hypothetical protein
MVTKKFGKHDLTRIFHRTRELAGELVVQIVQNDKRQYYLLACRRFGQAGRQQPGENRIATIDSL